MTEGLWRIGELSRRVGVSPQVLRAWERRYGLLQPQRSAGRYRLYTAADEERVRQVVAFRAAGHATAEAARLASAAVALRPAPPADGTAAAPAHVGLLRELLLALQSTDEAGAQRVLDTLFALIDLDTALVAVILPALATIGERWAEGELDVAVEHHAANLVQARLLALARGWDGGAGPRAVLACAPGEMHAIGLIAFGLALHRRGWRIVYLGPNMPLDGLIDWTRSHRPAAVVISATDVARFAEHEQDLALLASAGRLLLGGAAAAPCASLAARIGALTLDADPVTAAEYLSRLPQP
ncbi:MAG: hypothetical protein NVSMB51_08470 [Solirubrobacteraceae bacterium]